MNEKLVLLHGFSRDETLAIVKAVKACATDPAEIAFATTTPTNLGWKVGELVEHVMEEHKAFTGGRRTGE